MQATDRKRTSHAVRRVPVMLPYPLARPVRLPRSAGSGPSARRCRPGSAEPPRGSGGGVGRPKPTRACPDGQAEAAGRRDRHTADASRAAPVRRLGGQLHPCPARRGDGHGAARCRAGGRWAGERLATCRTAAGRAGYRGAAQGAGRAGATRAARHRRPGARRRRRRRRGARHGGCRAAGSRRAAGRATVRHPRPGPSGAGPVAGPGGRRRHAAPGGGGTAFSRHAAGRRHRLRQDRGLSGGGRRMPAARPPGAGAAAGDRAVLAMAGAVRAPLRRRAGGVAFRPDLAGAADDLARGGRRRGAGGGRRPLGAVPAVPRPWPGRGRRGARDGVQAGGGRGLPRPRHGGGAGAVLRARRRCWSRRRRAWRRVANVEAGRYRRHHAADPARRRGAAGGGGDRPARRRRRSAAISSRRR